MSTNEGNITRVTVDLIFNGTYREDTGVYECLASNLLNKATRMIPLIVQCMLSISLSLSKLFKAFSYVFVLIILVIPSIENMVNDEVKNQKENVTFLYKVVGEPVPDISWYFNDVMINVSDNSSKYMIVSRSINITTTENTLTVYNVTSSDVGTYTCNASNIIGSVASSGILTVTSKFIL